MRERWLPVPGYEGFYEVSDLGRVRGLDRVVMRKNGIPHTEKGRMRKLGLAHPNGYLNVGLYKAGQPPRVRLVHQLVMETFVGPRPAGYEVLHADDNPGNNRLSNLRYGTHAENVRDCVQKRRDYYGSRDACANGHDFTPENTFRRSNGGRGCHTCMRKWRRDYEIRRRQKESAA